MLTKLVLGSWEAAICESVLQHRSRGHLIQEACGQHCGCDELNVFVAHTAGREARSPLGDYRSNLSHLFAHGVQL